MFFWGRFYATFKWSQNLKNPPSKVAQKYSFFLPIATQMAHTEEFIFQNLVYRAAVYGTEG